MVMVNFLTIDHGVNSRVSWSWSVPYKILILRVQTKIQNCKTLSFIAGNEEPLCHG